MFSCFWLCCSGGSDEGEEGRCEGREDEDWGGRTRRGEGREEEVGVAVICALEWKLG